MYELDKAYGEKFFRRRQSLNWRVQLVGDAIKNTFKPKSVVDVGCGNGDIIGYLRKSGIGRTFAIEGTKNSIESIKRNYNGTLHIHDIRTHNLIYTKYDLCICLEVAEHVEDEYASVFVENLVNLSDTVLFSFAKPGQKGHYHVNCKPTAYWFYKFDIHNYDLDYKLTKEFKRAIEPMAHKKGIKAYAQNAHVFRKIL